MRAQRPGDRPPRDHPQFGAEPHARPETPAWGIHGRFQAPSRPGLRDAPLQRVSELQAVRGSRPPGSVGALHSAVHDEASLRANPPSEQIQQGVLKTAFRQTMCVNGSPRHRLPARSAIERVDSRYRARIKQLSRGVHATGHSHSGKEQVPDGAPLLPVENFRGIIELTYHKLRQPQDMGSETASECSIWRLGTSATSQVDNASRGDRHGYHEGGVGTPSGSRGHFQSERSFANTPTWDRQCRVRY